MFSLILASMRTPSSMKYPGIVRRVPRTRAQRQP
jgi:hypothetical protein